MNHLLYLFLLLASRMFLPRYNARMQMLIAQIRILRARIDSERIVPTPDEKAELLRWGALMDHNIQDVMHIVKPATYRRWLCQSLKGTEFKKSGRPPLAKETRELIVRLATENIAWGYRRIVGELKKLSVIVGATSVKRIVKDAGLPPMPAKAKKNPPVPWTTFVHAHLESMLACDFFTKPVWTLKGKVDAYVLVFLHLGSRKVYCSRSTDAPDSAWVMQQSRNATMWLEENGVKPKYLIRDGDRKFPDKFKEFWKAENVRVIRIPPRSPRANAFVEAFIGTLKHESLNNFICFSLGQLDYIVRCWKNHYNPASYYVTSPCY
jgi:putative transposase